MSRLDDEFLSSFHTEKLRTMEQRSRYVQLKIGFILGILGLGSLGTQHIIFNPGSSEINSNLILLITPLVAIGYDLYINGSDHSIKRMGAFIRENSNIVSNCEVKWEEFVTMRRGSNASLANLIFSSIATVSAFLLLRGSLLIPKNLLWIWFLITQGIIVAIFIIHRNLVKEYDTPKPDTNMPF